MISNCVRLLLRRKPKPMKQSYVLRSKRKNRILFRRTTDCWKTFNRSAANWNRQSKRWRSRVRPMKINYSAWTKSTFILSFVFDGLADEAIHIYSRYNSRIITRQSNYSTFNLKCVKLNRIFVKLLFDSRIWRVGFYCFNNAFYRNILLLGMFVSCYLFFDDLLIILNAYFDILDYFYRKLHFYVIKRNRW